MGYSINFHAKYDACNVWMGAICWNLCTSTGSWNCTARSAILAFGLPNWTSEGQLKTAAQSFGLIAVLFVLLQLYQILISQAAPGGAMDWISTTIAALFAIGLFTKSR